MSAQSVVDACLAVADGWARSAQQLPAKRVQPPNTELTAWKETLDSSTTSELIEATGRLTTRAELRDANLKAVREAMISEIERRNAEHLAATMRSLDSATTRLTWISILLAIVGVGLGAIQVWQTATNASQKAPPTITAPSATG
jgi:hypothetical protein